MGQAEVELGGDRPGARRRVSHCILLPYSHVIRAPELAWPLLRLCRAKVSPGSKYLRADGGARVLSRRMYSRYLRLNRRDGGHGHGREGAIDTLDQKRNEVEGKGRKGDRDGQTDMLPPAKLASKTKSKPKLEEETKYSFPPSLISPRPPFGVISE